MARMIPPVFHENTTSLGEKEIFRRLREDDKTKDWFVLHSLDIASHKSRISGEIDFVIIVPHKGVLCIEIKACTKLMRKDGAWYYGDDKKADYRGPFKQAAESMHKLRRLVAKKDPSLSNIVFWTAVAFPYITYSEQSPEWNSWQIIDNRDFNSQTMGYLVTKVLDSAREYLKECRSTKWFDPRISHPSQQQCEKLVSYLRPNFEFQESVHAFTKRREQELKFYTAEQFQALDAMEENHRCAFVGPAGTGKTFLAIEAARRTALRGRKVLFLCYNRLLGQWLREQIETLELPITIKTLHRHMLDITQTGTDENKSADNYWREVLPSLAIEKLLQDEKGKFQYDALIIDEAQDIIWENYLDFLDLILKGGLSSGYWRFFGDFEKQNIYGTTYEKFKSFVEKRSGNAPVYSLRTNCRNTPRIAATAEIFGQLIPGYFKILRPDDGLEPDIFYYSNDIEQQEGIKKILQNLLTEKFFVRDIVILSLRSEENSIASKIPEGRLKFKLHAFDSNFWNKDFISYGSIHAFKGLEAPVVVVTDIDKIDTDISAALLYVAITRAQNRLVIFAHDSLKKDVLNILLKHKNEVCKA